MEISERYTSDPYKDANLDETEKEEYELLRNLYYFMMSHGEIEETFPMWIKKNKNNLDGIIDRAKKLLGREGKFQSYLRA